MAIFLTGCTHFGHENIIKLAGRPFENAQEMDEAIIRNWNAIVGERDTVYHLGDFAFRSAPGEEYLKRLNGKIVMLQGNHDPKGWGVDYQTLKHKHQRCILFHYPIEEWDGWYRGSMHFHCHTHKSVFLSGKRGGNVGVDATGFTPINLETAIEMVQAGE